MGGRVSIGAPHLQALRCGSDAARSDGEGRRLRRGNGTCGWYFTAGDDYSDDPNFFKPIHVAHLEKYCPDVLPYLALPPGWRIVVGTGLEQATFDPQLLADDAAQ